MPALILLATLSVAAAAPVTVTWEVLPRLAAETWREGPGAAAEERAQGSVSASRRPQRGPAAVWAEVQRGLPAQDQLTVAVDLPLRLGLAETRAGEAQAEATRAAARADQAAWSEAVRVAWLDGWAARENSLHLEEYSAELSEWVAPLEAAAARGLVARLDVAELRVEQARVRAEKAASDESAAAADARLSALLGTSARVDPNDEALHALELPAANPWPALEARAAQVPEVAAARAQARAADADRRALWSEALPTASLGGMTVQGPEGAVPLVFGGLSLPLRTDGAARRIEARAAAAAQSAEARWQESRAQARISAEALRWDAARSRIDALERELIAPLQDRQDQTLAAVQAGLAPASRLVLARRDLHEAEHEQILVLVSLLASQARAAALSAALDASGDR